MSDENINIDQKKNNYIKVFSKYKKIIYTTLIFLITGLVILVIYNNIKVKENRKISENFNKAKIMLNQENKSDDVRRLLYQIINKENKFYSILALNTLIENDLESEQTKIIENINKIIDSNKFKKNDKDLLRLKKAFYISNTGSEIEILKTLNVVINSNSIWKKSAVNFLEKYYLDKGQIEKSKEFTEMLKVE